MIVSASYKTDIPAFYGEWFSRRLAAGYCMTLNPYNRTVSRVDLSVAAVDGFVFWTKNIAPFTSQLQDVRARGMPFVVQYTVNGYPRALESAVMSPERSIEWIRQISGEYGEPAVVWRYDTILVTSETPVSFHLTNFERIARALEGVVSEVVISFAHFYAKTQRNLDAAAARHGFAVETSGDDEKLRVVRELLFCARACGMKLTICSQPHLALGGAQEARCVDTRRFEALTGKALLTRLHGNRPGCGCFESRDIGEYDSCPHGCVYCYAVSDGSRAKERYRSHNPSSEFLIEPPPGVRSAAKKAPSVQLPLFEPERPE